MSLTLELPTPINEELAQDSKREGISEVEHAALLVCLATAFKQDEPHTPFQKAVRAFLSNYSLDARQVVAAFEELVRVCLTAQDTEKIDALTGKGNSVETFLRHWRNAIVHQQADNDFDSVLSDVLASDTLLPLQERASQKDGRGEDATDPRYRVSSLLARWQADDHTPLRGNGDIQSGETPTQALFRKWALEDAVMTDAEKDAEDRMWEDIEPVVRESRLQLSQKLSA